MLYRYVNMLLLTIILCYTHRNQSNMLKIYSTYIILPIGFISYSFDISIHIINTVMSSYRYIINILIKDDTCSNETIMNTPKNDVLYLFIIYYNIEQQTMKF